MNTIQNYGLNYNVNMKGDLSKIKKMKEIPEASFDKLIASMPKTKKGLIDKRFLDKEDKEALYYITESFRIAKQEFKASVDNLKNFFKSKITNEKQEIYNCAQATVRRDLYGNVRAVKTAARTEKEAVKELGLKQCGITVIDKSGRSYHYENSENLTGVPLYKAEYTVLDRGQQCIEKDYFTWNSKKNEMQLEDTVIIPFRSRLAVM